MRLLIFLINLLALSACNTQEGTEDATSTGDHPEPVFVVDDTTGQSAQSLVDTFGSKPPDGVYTYDMAFAEWQGKSMGEQVTVVIKEDSIKVIYDGNGNLTAKKGEVLEQGIIMKHESTGKWIIGHKPIDARASEIGGCSGWPTIIDFKNKKFWTC